MSNSNITDSVFQDEEFADLLSELTWNDHCYTGSQRAVARITGLAQTTITQGLGLDPSRQGGAGQAHGKAAKNAETPSGASDEGCTAKAPKMLEWLAAQGVSPAGIQAAWRAGRIKDSWIALLIRYAAHESQSKPREARRWMALISGVGFRQVIHNLKGVSNLQGRIVARSKNLEAQAAVCERIGQTGQSFQNVRSNLAHKVFKRRPVQLNLEMRIALPGVIFKKKANWRSYIDAPSLNLMSAAESLYAVTGNLRHAEILRNLALDGGWTGYKWEAEAVGTKGLKALTGEKDSDRGHVRRPPVQADLFKGRMMF